MINTAMFESLERYKRLDEAVIYLLSQNSLSPYEWMRPLIIAAMQREQAFMQVAKNDWLKKVEEES